MKQIVTIIISCLLSMLMAACVSEPLKAPCDNYATFCGTKTKINHW